ncbi:hypothetical protein CBM2614_B50051 [Cupriavidus taiwanensis]|nr:hypothetical protein CBM2614_B50051 [Cupriavidus taiwanensis]
MTIVFGFLVCLHGAGILVPFDKSILANHFCTPKAVLQTPLLLTRSLYELVS